MAYIPETLRHFVIERATHQCEYCLIHQQDSLYTHEIDHIIPEKHRGQTTAENLCLSCLDCNRHKGSDFASFDPETDEIATLYHPRSDHWADHFRYDNGFIIPLSDRGRVTVFILHLNDLQRVRIRRHLSRAGRYSPP
jgi:hypothetical protein